jgi:membrane-associated phospholipid phosphatase
LKLKYLIEIEKKPRKGLLAAEWVIVGYMVLTLLFMLFTWTKLPNPEPMLWGRFHFLAMTAALWGVYRVVPCRFTMLCRVGLQLALLSWWYPDTFDLNRILPNFDPFFAGLEQSVFGYQPALLFSQQWSHPIFSELMYMGYSSYFLLIVIVTLYYFFRRYQEFDHAVFVILGSFFVYYVIFVFLPVTGPQYYYLAAGLDNIAQGIFPPVGDYFLTHDQMMEMPGYQNGFFYQFMVHAHAAGERPTAAFPSSHVGVTLILLMLAFHSRSWRLTLFVLPFFLLMCLATVFIRAHYAIDVVAGGVSAVLIYLTLFYIYRRF